MHIDEYGRASTTDRSEAYRYRIKDEQPQFHRIKQGLPPIDKYTKLYSYDRSQKVYRLPPVAGKGSVQTTPKSWLRPAQAQAIAALKPVRSALITAVTGVGKSYILMGISVGKTIVIAPTIAIANGLKEKYLEMGYNADTMVASKVRKNINELPTVLILTRASAVKVWDAINGSYQTLAIDEAHYLSETMIHMINTFKGSRIIGVTATPRRKELMDNDFIKYFNQVIDIEGAPLPVKVLVHKFRYDCKIVEYLEWTKDLKDPTSPEALRVIVNSCQDRITEIKKVIFHLRKKLGLKRIIIFVDRMDYLDKLKSEFPQAIEISGRTNKDTIAEQLKSMDEYLIIGTSGTVGVGFDVPAIQCGVLLFSTKRQNTVEQLAGRARRESQGKTEALRVDFQDHWKVHNQYRTFGSKDRIDLYNELGREINDLVL